ncbi:hypothetical protein S83_070033 [Arachis hypogaea]
MTPKEKCNDKGSLTSSQFADHNNSKVSLSLEQRQLLMSLVQQDDTQLQATIATPNSQGVKNSLYTTGVWFSLYLLTPEAK